MATFNLLAVARKIGQPLQGMESSQENDVVASGDWDWEGRHSPAQEPSEVVVEENPTDVKNIGTVIRNANALGVEKVYVVDTRRSLPDDWEDLRRSGRAAILKLSIGGRSRSVAR